MSCNCAESTAVADRRDAYEDFVKKQLDALHQSLLRRYDTELLHGYGHVVRDDEVQVGKRHVVSVTVDDRLRGVPPLERSHEDSEDAFFYPRWIELTAKMLQMKDNDEGNSQDDFTENDLHMLPMWNISLQDLKRRTRPRNFRTMFTHDKKGNLKMKDTIREELSCLHRMVLQPNSWQQLLWTAIGATLILWDLITIPLGFFFERIAHVLGLPADLLALHLCVLGHRHAIAPGLRPGAQRCARVEAQEAGASLSQILVLDGSSPYFHRCHYLDLGNL